MNSLDTEEKITQYLPKINKRSQLRKFLVICLLLGLILLGAIPRYFQGQHLWTNLESITDLHSIQNLKNTGIQIPSWTTLELKEVYVGKRKWIGQIIQKAPEKPVTILLLPQPYYRDKPEVEWMDIQGMEHWRTDSYNQINFTLTEGSSKSKISTRFFRAWNQRQTFAVIQWYAWTRGGNFDPNQWFWQDLKAQLNQKRAVWIAISVKIPMEPLGDLKTVQKQAEELTQKIHQNINNYLIPSNN